MRIDTHLHLWDLARKPFWLTPDSPALYQNRLPGDVRPEMAAAGVDAAILVQADASLDEAYWMLELAQKYSWIVGVVGWVDLTAPGVAATLDALTEDPHFKGVRPYPEVKGGLEANRPGLRALARHRLACDLLDPQVLIQAPHIAADFPDVRFVLDHLAQPFDVPGGLPAWKDGLRSLAKFPNVALKVSGYLTAAKPKPLTPQELWPYLETALELFGSQRLMFGSDWPICTLAGGYSSAVAMLKTITSTLSASEQADIWGVTAQDVYRK